MKPFRACPLPPESSTTPQLSTLVSVLLRKHAIMRSLATLPQAVRYIQNTAQHS